MVFNSKVLAVVSHPTWVRGLKLKSALALGESWNVAPYVGAWIETVYCLNVHFAISVAPYVGAWIETCYTF